MFFRRPPPTPIVGNSFDEHRRRAARLAVRRIIARSTQIESASPTTYRADLFGRRVIGGMAEHNWAHMSMILPAGVHRTHSHTKYSLTRVYLANDTIRTAFQLSQFTNSFRLIRALHNRTIQRGCVLGMIVNGLISLKGVVKSSCVCRKLQIYLWTYILLRNDMGIDSTSGCFLHIKDDW